MGMRTVCFWLLATMSAISCSKGSDSAAAEADADTDTDSDTDTDTDTDSDTDSDTDTDTDSDTDTEPDGTIEFTNIDENETSLCTGRVDLTFGPAYTGYCPDCDFAFEVTAAMTSETGTCDWNLPISLTYGERSDGTDTYLAFSSDHAGGQYLWVGFASKFAKPGNTYLWYSYAFATPDAVSEEGTVSYSKGLLEWSIQTFRADSLYVFADITYLCAPDTGHGLTYDAGGAYEQTSSLDCYLRHYDRWSFVGTDAGYANVTVDTVSATTAFDPMLFVVDDKSCYLGSADESFECTFAPTNHKCSSYQLPTEKGVEYSALVLVRGDCAGPIGEYQISIDASADPSLTLVNANAPWSDGHSVVAKGSARIP